MELNPTLEIGWLNGWILLALFYLTYGILMLIFPKDVIKRLYDFDRSSWSTRQKIFLALGKLFVLAYFAVVVFTPLKIDSFIFIIGIVVFGIGLAGFNIALFNFKNTPLDQPATMGLYSISRHPQVLMGFILCCGISISIGSWLALLIQIIALLFGRSRTFAEEQSCLKKFGDAYLSYMKKVPRHFLIH